MSKVALLIPCTSNKRPWKNIKESYFYNLSLKTFLLTMDKEHEYTIYIGYDKDDIIFDNIDSHKIINRFSDAFKNVHFKFIMFRDIKRGYLTKMWNCLHKIAFNDNNDYFFQCGDDIHFATKHWINDCIETLKSHNDIGLTGPINNNNRILTQAFVSRKHMEIFGYFFPEKIINWCCDDWYNEVYKPYHFFPLHGHFCSNEGREPRYIINNNTHFLNPLNARKNIEVLRSETYKIANEDRIRLQNYIVFSK